ncbi:hypothetical protein LCGC14_1929480 [marine sediment metagenome]|uniref:Uncharacterized protein n=1 Tax=marine sediment metagenome TaxID=412755 RepID=A0A0F9I2B1_9ZZZZ
MWNILDCCKNKICQNNSIKEELDNFKKREIKNKYKKYFDDWYKEMIKRNKIAWIQLDTSIKPKIKDPADVKFYQTANNTKSKIFVTQESYLLSIKEKVYEEFGIRTITVEEANEVVKKYEMDIQ